MELHATRKFGPILRSWRLARGWSQMRLAGEAGISARHIGFIELGRSGPSRQLVCRLGEILALPLRERNDLLLAAGYAPAYSTTGLDSREASQVGVAVDFILQRHQPYPAIALDRCYDIERSNASFRSLLAAIGAPAGTKNLLEGLHAVRQTIVNWDEVHSALSLRLAKSGMPRAREEAADERARTRPGHGPASDAVLLATHFRTDVLECRLFSVISTLGTVYDAALEELRIESFFPADEASNDVLLALAEDA